MLFFKKKRDPKRIYKIVRLKKRTEMIIDANGSEGRHGTMDEGYVLKYKNRVMYIVDIIIEYDNGVKTRTSRYSFKEEKDAREVYNFIVNNKGKTIKDDLIKETKIKI